jgi:hypothetical protein
MLRGDVLLSGGIMIDWTIALMEIDAYLEHRPLKFAQIDAALDMHELLLSNGYGLEKVGAPVQLVDLSRAEARKLV